MSEIQKLYIVGLKSKKGYYHFALAAKDEDNCSEGIQKLIEYRSGPKVPYQLMDVREMYPDTIYTMMKNKNICLTEQTAEALCNFMYYSKEKKKWVLTHYNEIDYSILNIALDMNIQIMFHPAINKEKYGHCAEAIKKNLRLHTDKVIYNVFGERNEDDFINIPMLIGTISKNVNPTLFCFVFPGNITADELFFIQKVIKQEQAPNFYAYILSEKQNDKVLII